MIVAVQKETCPGEQRVALVPQGAAQLRDIGHEVRVESGAGACAHLGDAAYEAAGATIVADRDSLFRSAEVILQVRGPGSSPQRGLEDLPRLREGQILIGLQEPLWEAEILAKVAAQKVSLIALETLPRITRAQSMDVLSSMATLAGYRAVLAAASVLPKIFPMLMTAAGTVTAARVFVLGAGVAGLQAIATARRLGAVVQGYDIRPAAVEQIRSLGAKAVEIPVATEEAEDAGGYAKEQGEDFHRRQQEHLGKVVAGSDVVITTAAVPGARSPMLVSEEMVRGMSHGSVIVDLASERGGNCELTLADQTVVRHGVTILGPTDLVSRVPVHASQMFSNNLTTLLKHLTSEGRIELDREDEITRGTLVADGGEVLHPGVRAKLGLPEPAAAVGSEGASQP